MKREKSYLVAAFILCIACVAMLSVASFEPTEKLTWRRDAIPVGAQVVCMKIVNGEVILTPAIMTDYAGLFEFSLNLRPVTEVVDYDYWAYLPGGIEP